MQNAGKTTILYRLSLGQLVKTAPTIGSNVEELNYNNVKFQAWDLGGQESTRSVWDVYYMNTDAVVYVIDSQDEEFYEESKLQFHKLIKHPTLKNAAILIFANKQDLKDARNVSKLIQDYELDSIKDHIWHIEPCSAIKGEGLINGIKWLSDQLVFRGKNNFPINPYETDSNSEDKKINNSSENKDISITVKDEINTNSNLNINSAAVINKIEDTLETEKHDNINVENADAANI